MKRLTLLFFILSACGTIKAQEQIGLQQAIEIALRNSPNVQNAMLEIEKARYDMIETRAIGLPQVNGSLEYSNFPSIPTQLFPDFVTPAINQGLNSTGLFDPELPVDFGQVIPVQFGQKHNFTAGIEASQLLFDGSFFFGLKAAGSYVELKNKELKSAQYDVKINVTQAYYTVLVVKENQKLIEQNIGTLSKLLLETKALFENGFVEEIEVDRLQLSKNNLDARQVSTQRQYEAALGNLKLIMGLKNDHLITITEDLAQLLKGDSDPQFGTGNYQQRIDYQILESQESLNDMNIRVNKSRQFPTAHAFGQYSQNAQRDEFNFLDFDQDWYKTFVVGVRLNIPIFSGLGKRAAIQKAAIDKDRVRVYKNQLEKAIDLEILTAKNELSTAEENLTNQKSSLALAEKIYNISVLKYKEGVGSSLEVTNAEQQLFQTQTLYINSIYELLLARLKFQKARGI